MKKCIILLLVCLILTPLFAQTNDNSKIGLYKWKEAVLIKHCNIDGTEIPQPEVITKSGQMFRVLKIIEGSEVIIQILDYTESITSGKRRTYQPTADFFKYNFIGTTVDFDSLTEEQVISKNYGQRQAYFKVGITLIDQHATKESYITGSLAAGVINFPFKYRPQKGNSDFSGSFNFGAGIGYTFKHKIYSPYTHSIISGYSISNIVLDASNVKKNQDKLETTNNFTAFSFSLGYLIQYQSVQAGIFIGWDRISKINHLEFDWQYQGKTWISVGFGLAIFSSQKEKSNEKQATTQFGE